MATSRYLGMDSAGNSVFTETSPTSSTTNQSGNTSSNTSGTSTTNQNSVEQTTTNQQNMSDDSLAALETLIRQLMGGGTQQMAQDQARRIQEIMNVQAQRAGYSKENAFADAEGLMAQTLQQAMERAMPQLARAAEGAGASQNSMRALLTQDALNRASQSASALGLDAAVNYGGIASNLSQVLEALTRPNTTVSDALLQALNTAKGAVTSGTSTTTGSSSSTTNQNSQTNSNTQGSSTTNNSGQTSVKSTDPFYFNTIGGGSVGELSSVSGGDDGSSYSFAGSNITPQELAASLMGGGNDWDDYSF